MVQKVMLDSWWFLTFFYFSIAKLMVSILILFRFLGTAGWNFRESLESFTELFREQQIPPEAFA